MSLTTTVTKRYEWDMGHRLPNHNGKCSRLHGHRYVAEIDITGPVSTAEHTSSEGMVIDFYDLQRMLDVYIGEWDHRTMLHVDDELVRLLHSDTARHLGIFAVPFIPTAENIAAEIFNVISGVTDVHQFITRVRVYETPSGWAEVRPVND
jgi:6-pyruvoyltetrahydropterin/6-carboxytetrahydropterin synthase